MSIIGDKDETLLAELIRDEGLRLKPYVDTVGVLTVGVGRNLRDVGISEGEARYLLQNDVAKVKRQLDESLPWWRELDDCRQRVLANMAFNLGIGGLLGFKNTLAAMKAKQWDKAASGMLASKWASDVGARATRLAQMMKTGRA